MSLEGAYEELPGAMAGDGDVDSENLSSPGATAPRSSAGATNYASSRAASLETRHAGSTGQKPISSSKSSQHHPTATHKTSGDSADGERNLRSFQVCSKLGQKLRTTPPPVVV